MIFIGVTGGIGSGKSTICSLFEKKSVPIFYADLIGRELSEHELLEEITKVFGKTILDSQKHLDRKILAEIVFKNPEKLEILNSIIHPAVFKAFEKWKSQIIPNSKYAIAESALMFESGMVEHVDYVLAVVAEESIRRDRVSKRDQIPGSLVQSRINHQFSNNELMELSDFHIQNNGTIMDITPKINFFHSLFSTLDARKEIE